jgi:hypothetical protein
MTKFIPGVTELLGGSRPEFNSNQRYTWKTCYDHLKRHRRDDRDRAISATRSYLRRRCSAYTVEDVAYLKSIRLSITWEDGAHKEEMIPYE